MSLKKRLMISNAAIVVIPILITIVASFVFIFVYSSFFNADVSYENIEKLNRIKVEFFSSEGEILGGAPDRLLDKDFQQYLEGRLSGVNAGIIVLKEHDIVFSTRDINKIDLEKCLDTGKLGLSSRTVSVDGIPHLVSVAGFTYQDGKQGRTIFLAPVSRGETASEKFLWFALIIFFVSFLIANTIFSLAYLKRILNPMARLRTAAEEISKGNLNYEVIEEGDEEFKALCRSFEQMRLKLKESVYLEMKYDDNRKMLVSSISHDLKTPITSIKGYVEGIMDGVANTPEKVEKYLKTVYTKANQVDGMIDDLLLYSKLDLNQIPFRFEKTDVVAYFTDCIAEYEGELEKYNIRIIFQNELKGSPFVMMDRERVRRVVVNIIDNARKYMNKPQGEIAIILRQKGPSLIIEIKDNGAGIPKGDLPRVFDRFYRADASRSRVNGSGLGLAIARQIIEGHEGRIWVKSRENEGTSIIISLKKVE